MVERIIQRKTVTRRPIGLLVDSFLSKSDLETLYQKWSPNWEEPYDFGGGEKGITCEQIVSIPKSDFLRVFGKAVGNRIYEIARFHYGREA